MLRQKHSLHIQGKNVPYPANLIQSHDLLCDQMLTQEIWAFVLLETKSAWE